MDNIVDHSIDIDGTGLGHLTFPLDVDNTSTTDGVLLSSLTTDTIHDDLSSGHVLRVLPHSESSYTRLLPPTPTQFENVLLTSSSYELTELGATNQCDIGSKLSDGDVLGRTIQTQSNSNHSTWSQLEHQPNEYMSDYLTLLSSNKLPEFRTFVHSEAPQAEIASMPITQNCTFVQIAEPQMMAKTQNMQEITYTHFQTKENETTMRPEINVTTSPVVQNNTSYPTFTMRVPLPNSLGKGLQLQIVAKGNDALSLYSKTQSNVNVTQQNGINLIYCGQLNNELIDTSTKMVLIHDRTTDNNFLVATESSTGIPITIQEQVVNSTLKNPPVTKTDNNDLYGDLGIAEPQPVIDVNEFLNIPTKGDKSSKNDQNNDKTCKEGSLKSHENNTESEDMIESDLDNFTSEDSESGNEIKDTSNIDFTKVTTGVDLIKMLAFKKCDKAQDKNNHGPTDNNENKTNKSGCKVVKDKEMDSYIIETEQRIASIVPESMKDFVRDIFEDEDALDKEYIQEIMDDTGPPVDHNSALSPGEIAKHAVQKLVNTVEDLQHLEQKAKISPNVMVHVDKAQIVEIDGQRKWQCSICPKMYNRKQGLVTHTLSHCDVKPHHCVLCSKAFKQLSHLHTHMLVHRQVKEHMCKECGKAFSQASHLKRHSAMHFEKRPFLCEVCNRGFAYASDFKKHQENHENKQGFHCDKCDEVYDTAKKLKLHASKHRDSSELTCKDCGKVCVYPSQLRDHMLKHTGVRAFICKECGLDFMKEHHLKAHQITHTGEQPFACKICQRSFNQKANLKRHMLIHEDKKRFMCHICDRKFSQPQVLKSHIATHNEKPFKCEECGKRFSRHHNLKGHLAMHKGKKKYVCFCGESFTIKGNLNRHQKHKHNLDEEPIEQMAAETAAKILNMMSAKKIMDKENDENVSADNTQIIIRKDKHSVKRILPKESTTDISPNEDSSATKKKRKSVPSKIIAKEGQVAENGALETEDLQSEDGKSEAINTIKRKQLKPKCLVMNTSGETEEITESSNQLPVTSQRRKQKAVAKAGVLEEALQDEAEQEWQGTSLDGSRSEMDTIVSLTEKETCINKSRENNDNDQRTSFSNLCDIIRTSNVITQL